MRIKNLIDEDFINYKLPSMFIGSIKCGGKCCSEQNIPFSICQNDEWRKLKILNVDDLAIIKRYLGNNLTKSIVFGGLEPFEQFEELIQFIHKLRIDFSCKDDVVIYTGYYENEITKEISELKKYENIVIKYGRYLINSNKKYDDVLGIYLASENQYGERIS